jgi:hypothetical protein
MKSRPRIVLAPIDFAISMAANPRVGSRAAAGCAGCRDSSVQPRCNFKVRSNVRFESRAA